MKIVPKISVLMAVFNGQSYLRESIDSILSQTFTEFEFIIIDDFSTDNTSFILDSYKDPRIKKFRNSSNIGLTKSLNIGLSIVLSTYVARQDADDISHPRRLEMQYDFFSKNSDLVILGTQARSIDKFGNVSKMSEFKPITYSGVKYQLFFGNPFIHSTVMFKVDIIRNTFGGYNEDFRLSQDFELWSKVIPMYRCMNLNSICLDYRHNPTSVTKFNKSNFRVYEETYNKNVALQLSNLQLLLTDDFNEWPFQWIQLNVPKPQMAEINPSLVYRLMNKLHTKSMSYSEVNYSELKVLASINYFNASIRMVSYSYKYSFLLFLRAFILNAQVVKFAIRAVIRQFIKVIH